MLDEWDITHNRMDLPPEAWKFIREKGFLGIIIPKSYGGLGFSAFAHTEIVTKISTRSGTAAVTVMVPNSLGPAELLIHYRHGGAEEPLPATPRQGPRNPVLRAHQSGGRVGCGRDSRLRHRLQGHARGPRGAGRAPHLGEALHHPRAGRDHPRHGIQALRPRQAARGQGGGGHHARPHSDHAQGREHRAAPHPARRGLHERPELGQGRVHPDAMDHRRRGADRQRLADAGRMPCGRPLDLAAVDVDGRRQARQPRDRRLLARARAVQDADRPLRRRRGGAREDRRQHLHDGRHAPPHHDGARQRRETLGHLGDLQVPHDRGACAPS